jgi:predicted ATP-dependent protease
LRQGLAVTGSVNQQGDIQPVGGINEKIEAWYFLCKARGLTGDQGVVIPKANLDNLMLKMEVVEAVRGGKFFVYPITTVAEGIEILTGIPAGTRNQDFEFEPEDSIFARAARTLTRYEPEEKEEDEDEDEDEEMGSGDPDSK